MLFWEDMWWEVRNMIYVHIEHYLYCNWEKKKEKKNPPSVGPPLILGGAFLFFKGTQLTKWNKNTIFSKEFF